MGARRHHCTAVRLGRWSESGRGRARTPSIRQSCLTSARALCRKTSNESVRKPAAILNAQRGDRAGERYTLQTYRPAPRLRAGAPAYWFWRSPKLVVILLLGLLLLLFFRELRLLAEAAGWERLRLKALCVYDDEKSLLCSRGCPQFSSCKQEIAFSCRNFNKKKESRALALLLYTAPFL